jgi:hypothetical protein
VQFDAQINEHLLGGSALGFWEIHQQLPTLDKELPYLVEFQIGTAEQIHAL